MIKIQFPLITSFLKHSKVEVSKWIMWTFLFTAWRRVVRKLCPCCPQSQVDLGNNVEAMPATYDNGHHEVRVSVKVHVCVCVRAYMRVCVLCMCAMCVSVCACACVHVHTCVHVCTCVCRNKCVYKFFVYVCLRGWRVCVCVYISPLEDGGSPRSVVTT